MSPERGRERRDCSTASRSISLARRPRGPSEERASRTAAGGAPALGLVATIDRPPIQVSSFGTHDLMMDPGCDKGLQHAGSRANVQGEPQAVKSRLAARRPYIAHAAQPRPSGGVNHGQKASGAHTDLAIRGQADVQG
jgi:hypothetical protein